MKRFAPLALLALFPLSGCAIQYVEQEVLLRYDAAADSWDLLLVYKGITASDEKEKTVDEAASIVRRLLGGQRALASPWGTYDLDDPAFSGDDADVAQVAAGVSLLDWGLFLDEAERLAGFQRFRLANASRAVDCFNRQLSKALLEEASKEDFAERTPLLDDRTRLLWCQRAGSGEPWLYQVDEGIEIDLPMTRASWDRVQDAAISEATSAKSASAPNDGPAALLGQHLVYLRHFEIQDDRVILTFGAPVSHIFRFAIKEAGVKYSSQLKDALARAGVVLEKLEEPIGLEPR